MGFHVQIKDMCSQTTVSGWSEGTLIVQALYICQKTLKVRGQISSRKLEI